LKVSFWKELDKSAPVETIFASNSSGFPISAMAAATERPDRFIGWHWASPAPVMKLAEIVRGRETSQETVDTVVSLAESAGKNPVVISDTDSNWGYVTNRVYFAMVKEAAAVVNEGIADRDQVDQLMTDCFRWPSGPFGMTRGATSGWK
jgi:3-hydroxyacyl-CoA dehydrogenase